MRLTATLQSETAFWVEENVCAGPQGYRGSSAHRIPHNENPAFSGFCTGRNDFEQHMTESPAGIGFLRMAGEADRPSFIEMCTDSAACGTS
jgi:hypothetical protein